MSGYVDGKQEIGRLSTMSKRQTKSTSSKTKATSKTVQKTAAKTTAKLAAKNTTKAKPTTLAKTTKSKAPSKTASKAAVNTPVKAKPAKTTAPQPPKTVANLKEHFDGIVSRLKAADTNNRKSVKALETAFSTLEDQVKSHQSIDHAKLSKKVDELSSYLTQSLDKTKRDITADLKNALENPTVDGVEAAITRSEDRLAEAELAQARSMSKVNQHIADLARVIDARLKSHEGETRAQAEKIAGLEEHVTSVQSQSYERIRLVENTTADAMRKLGDEVVGTAESFQSQLANQSANLRERIETIAKRTQEDFDKQSTDLSRRMESIEDSQKNQSNYIDRSISKLAARIDSLEFGLSQLPPPEPEIPATPSMVLPATPEAAPLPPLESLLETPAETSPMLVPAPPPAPIAHPEPVTPVMELAPPALDLTAVEEPEEDFDAFAAADAALSGSSDNSLLLQPEAVVPYNQSAENIVDPFAPEAPQYTQPAAQLSPLAPASTDEIAHDGFAQYAPPEYNPTLQPGTVAPQHHYVDPEQAAYTQTAAPAMTHGAHAQTAYSYDPYQAQVTNPAVQPSPYETYDYSQQAGSTGPTEFTPPVADADLPYDNPGYSENPGYAEDALQSDGLSRPGHVAEQTVKRKRRKSGKSLLANSSALSNLATPKNLRVAGLALALAVTGYLGYKSFSGSNAEAPIPPTLEANNSLPVESGIAMPTQPVVSEISTTDPIGTPQMSAPVQTAPVFTGDQTLEAAAESGNSIAQFQLGITYLDTGQTEQGLKYIRAAANQNQPAAQYRLAKLYEAGVGVSADPDMARDLTERAARSGNRIAMHDLGLYYAEGRGGVEKNMQTALGWFEKAAERGVVDSQYNLGVLFSATPEIAKDITSAYVWFSVAAKQGDQFAANELARVKSAMSDDQLKQANARIAGFKPVAIDEAANGIFREVPWSMPDAANFAPTADLVRDAQSLLGQLGYEVGTPDGDMGPKTRAAVKAFEKANGLPETGVVSGSLIDRLEAAAGV